MEGALLLGHSASWWDGAMLVSLAVAALVAFIVAGATAGSVVANKREAAAAKAELERYKAGVSAQVSGAQADAANARERSAILEKEAADARLETEKLKGVVAWRAFNPTEAAALEGVLKAHPGSVNLRYMDGDPEALYLAIQLSQILTKAGWQVAPGASKPAGAVVFGFALPDGTSATGKTLRSAFAAAKIQFSGNALPAAGVEFNVSTIAGAPILMVGSKAPVVP